MSFTYSNHDLKLALEKCGIEKGDVLFCHSNIGFFGIPEGVDATDSNRVCDAVLTSVMEVIGEEGTFTVPSFTYSFGDNKKEKLFDPEHTEARAMGQFAEYVRMHPDSVRSTDPMFSVSAIGKMADELTENVSDECFGPDSFWDRFMECGGKICNFNFDSGSTLIHFIEKKLNVPYRTDLPFTGTMVNRGERYEKTVVYFCRRLDDPGAAARFERFDEIAKKSAAKTEPVGRGSVVVISAAQTDTLIKNTIDYEPYFLTKKGAS